MRNALGVNRVPAKASRTGCFTFKILCTNYFISPIVLSSSVTIVILPQPELSLPKNIPSSSRGEMSWCSATWKPQAQTPTSHYLLVQLLTLSWKCQYYELSVCRTRLNIERSRKEGAHAPLKMNWRKSLYYDLRLLTCVTILRTISSDRTYMKGSRDEIHFVWTLSLAFCYSVPFKW